jgi:hypothetical protein
MVNERGIDLVIAGPLTRVGMDAAGTLQDVGAFMQFIADMRASCRRRLTLVLIHHENKARTVSGAWEGAGDTLLHVQGAGNGHTVVVVQKARWASAMHGKTLKLTWTAGEGFELDADRNPVEEIEALLQDGAWRTEREIAAPKDKGGIGLNRDTVRRTLESNPDRFESRTGDAAKAVGRHPNATGWSVAQGSKPHEPHAGSEGGAGDGVAGVASGSAFMEPDATPAPSGALPECGSGTEPHQVEATSRRGV